MSLEQKNSGGNGSFKIADEVLETVASIALKDIEGVYGIAPNGKNIAFGIKTPGRSVRAELKDDNIIVSIDVVLNYGVKIPDVAWEIQVKVKKALESMTGLNVSKVNVLIKNLNIPEEGTETVPTTESNE